MKKDNCIFCKIANGEIPSNAIYEDELFKVILDLNPAAKGHALILPKNHFDDLLCVDEETASKALVVASKAAKAIKKTFGCDGINVIQNNGEAAGQTIFHLHFHIIPRYKEDKLNLTCAPGTASSEELAETAESIRKNME